MAGINIRLSDSVSGNGIYSIGSGGQERKREYINVSNR